ncbi:NAD(P)/FAD-dependent oxidoreductase [Microbacterium sp. No. 7]|uniref:NAD(P)/FAD-dependent oxidoreductase n=1 Tax=Microbacterium sp. No. 7 TaxID=1714373 RepID=UPI0006CFDC9A|nr:FAD-dependent oxidoreductase [Microbacterium sp. No. 7]ALJ21787.1 hypothetical protein AOA12_18560 [Microbacterium sp. No. 7]
MSAPREAGRVVIVGGGLAGYSAAERLRALGHDGPLTIVDPEPAAYDRPPLSKDLFSETFSLTRLSFANEDELAELRIDALFGRAATALDPETLAVTLDDGTVLPADTVLIATGGRGRALRVPGADLPGVQLLRTYDDAAALRAGVRAGSRVVVVGAGLIGAELASALHATGATVTLVDPVEVPLAPAVGEILARRLHDMHAARGIEVVVGVTAAIEADVDGLSVVLDDGGRHPADLVVVGIGIVPETGLAESAGIEVDGGIVVTPRHETSAPGVYAAGDVARLRDDDGTLHRREEHWEAAQLGGQHAACAILGLEPPERGASWFWSDRHGVHLEATGRLTGPGEIVVREGGEHPAVFLVEDGMLAGAAAVDDNNTVRAARRLIDRRVPVTPRELADPGVSLRTLLRAAR